MLPPEGPNVTTGMPSETAKMFESQTDASYAHGRSLPVTEWNSSCKVLTSG